MYEEHGFWICYGLFGGVLTLPVMLPANITSVLAVQKGIINIGKMIPVVGAIIGGGFDLVETSIIGKRAVQMFFDGDFSVGTEAAEPEEEQEEITENHQ